MTRFTPASITADDLETALAPAIGGERKVYVSEETVDHVADIRQPEENSGIKTMNTAYALPAAGKHLAVIVDRAGARSANSVMSIQFNVTFADSSTGTATATFSIPARSANQKKSMPQGTAVDLLPDSGGNLLKKIKTLGEIAAVVGGDVNNRFVVVAVPDLDADFSFVGCTNQSNFKLPIGNSLPIACGLNPSAFVKRGRGEAGTLNVIEKYSDYLHGLTRMNGLFVTAVVELWKDERVLTDRFLLANWRPMASPEIGDGDDVATATGEGNFSMFGVFTAR